MNVLFVYYIASGGMDTLNRQRCLALRRHGVNGHCLYYQNGSGMQNAGGTPTFVTSNPIEIKQILDNGQYDAVIVTTDYYSLQFLRNLGFTGKMFLEIQGLGSKETARKELFNAQPYVIAYANGLINPNTPHITALFQEFYPLTPKFLFNNCFDAGQFRYRPCPQHPRPVMAWMGRIEPNKNWREFLQIGSLLIRNYDPTLLLWMFEDANLSQPEERQAFYELVQQLGLGTHLQLFSNVPHAEMEHFLSIIGDSGGFLCSTSVVEGQPYSILEAMSCRCPVLTTNSDGVSNSIYHNETGKYYERGNLSDAVKEALELMRNTHLREHIRSTAEHHVQTYFNPDLYCIHFTHMLQSV
ncbi:glycosyltransferase [Paenibacillus sp. GCM10027628]|uniref:glycosyltransferase n=1 Tax=Paenibacillus sp. GCM10027628 TaxID=3273413 RepID=UPI00363EF842